MTLAVFGAVAIGEWSEAALVVVLFSLGTSLQAATLARTRGAIRGLMELTPPRVALMRSGVEVSVPASEARAGDLLLVRPGERLAVDGEVLEGHASANQAPITGEAAPVDKGPGDAVFAGSIVEGGSLLVRASSGLNDNSIAKIVHMVEDAQAQRAPLQTTVDRFASRYTPVVVGLALAVAIVPVVLGQPLATWLYRGLAVLIIACPCALVISTPVSILAGLTRAARDGILIKGGALLERSANVGAVAFDKTGTLTEGRPRVTDVVAFGGASEHRVLALSAAVERLSEHPLARAIVNAADAGLDGLTDGTSEDRGADASSCGCSCSGRCGATAEPCIVQRFRATPGTGVEAEVDGRRYFVGRPDQAGFADPSPLVKAAIQRLESEGKTVIALADDDAVLGVIALSDPLRPGAGRAVEHLRSLGVEHIVILTGDNRATAAAIARRVGIDEVRAGLLPAEKLAATLALRERTSTVAMVGDGVNDAPAMAGATNGIAMGAAGTDAALETADVVLMGDELEAIPETIVLARRTRRVVWQNIVLSIAVKALFLALAPLGLVTLWMAVFADVGTSLLVTANGLRLLRRGRNGRESHAGIRMERVTGGER
jgi:Cd2+/Zn2+-exporting ATPase